MSDRRTLLEIAANAAARRPEPPRSIAETMLQTGMRSLQGLDKPTPATMTGVALVAVGAFLLGQESKKDAFTRQVQQMRPRAPTPDPDKDLDP